MNIREIAEEAIRIYFNEPLLTVKECVEKAERMFKDARGNKKDS